MGYVVSVLRKAATIPTVVMLSILALLCVLFLVPLPN
jgi:hypothetical protein